MRHTLNIATSSVGCMTTCVCVCVLSGFGEDKTHGPSAYNQGTHTHHYHGLCIHLYSIFISPELSPPTSGGHTETRAVTTQ